MGDVELEDECLFSDQEYSTICEFAQNGQTRQMKEFLSKTIGQQSVGDQTFAADTTSLNPVRRLSPISYAARSGRVETVKCFLRQFPNAIALNPTAGGSFVHPRPDKHLRHDLPLYWACLNGHLEVAKVLVAAGALVNCPNCMQATPLHAAVSNGHLQVVEFLVGKGADLNTADIFGRSPLIAAASGGHAKAVEYLLGRGADVKQVTVDGYTVMHVAAERGHVHVVRILFAYGVPPLFSKSICSTDEEGLVPCPVFLAAVNGHESIVREFLSRKRKCPTGCHSDTMMLLGVGQQKAQTSGIGDSYHMTPSRIREMVERSWARGLELRNQANTSNAYFRSIQLPAYGNRKELDSMHELRSVIQSHQEVVVQSLIIMERCLGQCSQIIAESCLGQEKLELLSHSTFADECIHRVMQAAVQTWQTEIQRSVFRDPSAVQPLVENYLQRFGSQYTTTDIDSVQKSVDIGLGALEVLLELRAVHKCEGVSLQSALSSLLYLFAIWLQQDYASKSDSLVSCEMYSGPEECERLGQKLVSEHLHSLEGTTLLHMALNGSRLVSEAKLMSTGNWYSPFGVNADSHRTHLDLGLLIRALLRWGATAAIDVFDWNGQRPLHLAVKLTNMIHVQLDVITPLVYCGAHLDYVNKEGNTPLTMCQSDESRQLLTPPGPLPLTCLACHTIVKEKIAYRLLNIPTRVKNIIRNHDTNRTS